MKDQIVVEGQPAQFKTVVSPSKAKPTIQWYREGALIPQSPDFQVSIVNVIFQRLFKISFSCQTINYHACKRDWK